MLTTKQKVETLGSEKAWPVTPMVGRRVVNSNYLPRGTWLELWLGIRVKVPDSAMGLAAGSVSSVQFSDVGGSVAFGFCRSTGGSYGAPYEPGVTAQHAIGVQRFISGNDAVDKSDLGSVRAYTMVSGAGKWVAGTYTGGGAGFSPYFSNSATILHVYRFYRASAGAQVNLRALWPTTEAALGTETTENDMNTLFSTTSWANLLAAAPSGYAESTVIVAGTIDETVAGNLDSVWVAGSNSWFKPLLGSIYVKGIT